MKEKNSDNQMMYMPICMSIGISVGTAIGAALDNIPVWMCIGLSIGVGLGTVIDAKNKAKKPSEDTEKQDD